jgi:hypothetical protein
MGHTIRGELTVKMPISLCVLRFLRLFAAISSCSGIFLTAFRAEKDMQKDMLPRGGA